MRGRNIDQRIKWNIFVDLKQIVRPTATIKSVNHEIKTFCYINAKREAAVRILLGSKVHKDKATEKDFVLVFRD